MSIKPDEIREARAITISPADQPINAVCRVPGSKSITNRALVIASLGLGQTVLKGASLSEDAIHFVDGLESLGISVTKQVGTEGPTLTVRGQGAPFESFSGTIDVGAGGTTIRFMLPLCCLVKKGEIILEGTERLHERPIGDLVGALTALGADISFLGRPGCPPLLIKCGGKVRGGRVEVSGEISSQFLSSLLMAAPAFEQGLEVRVKGDQVSKPYVDMTTALMKSFGVEVEREGYQEFRVRPGQSYRGQTLQVEGDASGATYLLGLAAVSGGVVRVQNIGVGSLQGDVRFLGILEKMGCSVRSSPSGATRGNGDTDQWIEVRGPAELLPITADLEDMPDTAQTLAVLAATAPGTTVISGLQTLRHKETDRIYAVATELKKMGIHAEPYAASLTVHGGHPRGALIDTYEDHRMAMAFSMLGSRLEGVEIAKPRVVMKSFPNYWQVIEQCGLKVAVS